MSVRKMLFLIFSFAILFGTYCLGQNNEEEDKNTLYTREVNTINWNVKEFDAKLKTDINVGDVIVNKEKAVILNIDNLMVRFSPYSTFRILDKKSKEFQAPIVELLFGEATFLGEKTYVDLPGQKVLVEGKSYIVVDEEKYSMVAVIDGQAGVMNVNTGAEWLNVPGNELLEMGPGGEMGEITAMDSEDLSFFNQEVSGDEVANVNIVEKEVSPELITEIWNRTRITLIEEGQESEAGLAIARGVTAQRIEDTQIETIEAFDQEKGPVQKVLSFSTSVEVTRTASDIPVLTSISIGGKNATIGDTLSLDYTALKDNSLTISGKAAVKEPDLWKLYINFNDDEYLMDGVSSFSYEKKIVLDFAEAPSIDGVMIGNKSGDSFTEEGGIITREEVEGGKLIVSGSAAPGQNIVNYNTEIIAKDNQDNEYQIGKFQVELDLSEIESVQVSIDNGIGWEQAEGKSEWSFGIKPGDEEIYKIKVMAKDVLGNVSEEQFEPYQFKYSYRTDTEILKEIFYNLMQAYSDQDHTTFMRNVSQEFSSNYEDIRDYNELDDSLKERFTNAQMRVQYTVQDVNAYRDSGQGSVDFYWTPLTSSSAPGSIYAIFNFIIEDGTWKLHEVIDDDTFLRASRKPYSIELSLDSESVIADGEDTTEVTALVLDRAGSVVADGILVNFSVDSGDIYPEQVETEGGYANATYQASTNSGTAFITARAETVEESIDITLNPVQAPLPPDQE